MELISFENFLADIETTFSNFSATNDIDRIFVKGWVIECLRKFGKNICTKNETVVDVKNSKALLPETFRSMILGLRLTPAEKLKENPDKRLIVERQYIENPAFWDFVTHDYFADYCQSKITTERIYTNYEYEDKWYNYAWLSVEPSMNKDTLSVDCLNMNPIIRGKYPDKVSINKRTMSTNFKEGQVYLQYNSLPSIDNEIAIPVFSTGDILRYTENYVKVKLAEVLDINEKNSQSLNRWIPLWLQQDRQLFINAKSEASWSGIDQEKWAKNMYVKNRFNQNLYNLPK